MAAALDAGRQLLLLLLLRTGGGDTWNLRPSETMAFSAVILGVLCSVSRH